MELLLNDLSVHGQFSAIPEFRESIGRIMAMRATAREYGRELYSHRNIVNAHIIPGTTLFDALQTLTRDKKALFLGWLTKSGPFWEDDIRHLPDHYMECSDQIVTERALGEAAYCSSTHGDDFRLVSFAPSDWEYSPIVVQMVADTTTDVAVPNYWQLSVLKSALQQAEPPITSWEQMESVARSRFGMLTFSNDCFICLNGYPFSASVTDHILRRLNVLNRLMTETDAIGQRTPEGNSLYQIHFTGDRAWFSDSSDTEKRQFRRRLEFRHPEDPSRYLFCTWHGKVNNNPPFRIHFAWPPEQPGSPLFVAYVGPKLTRR